MDKNVIEAIGLFITSIWCIFKFFKSFDIKFIFLACFAIIFLLWRWPLYLPRDLSFGLIGFLAAAFLLYQNYGKGKKAQPLAYIYITLFITLGSMLLAYGFKELSR